MKIKIETGGKRFFIPVPLGLVKLGVSFMSKPFIMKHIPEKDRKYIDMINFNELIQCVEDLREYKGLRIVDVKAKDGTEVIITI